MNEEMGDGGKTLILFYFLSLEYAKSKVKVKMLETFYSSVK